MFHNYGGCAVYMKAPPPPFVINDYVYINNNGVVTLINYIGSGGDIVVPTPPNS